MPRPPSKPSPAPLLADTQAQASSFPSGQLTLGWLTRLEPSGGAWVDYEGNPHGALPALMLSTLDGADLREALGTGQPVVLGFLGGDGSRPLLLGLLRTPSPSPMLDALLESQSPFPAGKRVYEIPDEEDLVLEGRRKVTLRCGDASLTLERSGRVTLKGAYIESHARGTHRIKGGTVKIN